LAYLAKRDSSSGGRQMPGHYSSREHNVFSVCTPTGGSLLPACGTGWAMQLDGKDSVCIATIGDAAARQGEFFEAIAFAAQENLPVVFLVEDNKYGISTPTGKFLPFHLGILSDEKVVKVDARRPENVLETVGEAIDKARRGEGPTIVWCDLDRLSSHTSSDDHRVYRKLDFDQVGARIAIHEAVDMEFLGQALHLCIAKAGAHGHISLVEVDAILARWGVAGAVASQAVLDQLQAFRAWVERRWPASQVHVEVPLEVALVNGQRARGRIDFLVDTSAGWILLDHKANPRGVAREDALIDKHGPQLDAYADAIERATGRPVLEKWLFLPVAGRP
ncbi:MAG: hypothetical protein EON57_19985, partial [Alphaproteobacteria bacterium]